MWQHSQQAFLQSLACVAYITVIQCGHFAVQRGLRVRALRVGDGHQPDPSMHCALRALRHLPGALGGKQREPQDDRYLPQRRQFLGIFTWDDSLFWCFVYRWLVGWQLFDVSDAAWQLFEGVHQHVDIAQSVLIPVVLAYSPVLLGELGSGPPEPQHHDTIPQIHRHWRPMIWEAGIFLQLTH